MPNYYLPLIPNLQLSKATNRLDLNFKGEKFYTMKILTSRYLFKSISVPVSSLTLTIIELTPKSTLTKNKDRKTR